jgi:hypothetical protein
MGTILRSSFRINLCSSASSTTLVGATTSSSLSSPCFSVGDEVPDSLAIGEGCSASLRKKPMAWWIESVRVWKGHVGAYVECRTMSQRCDTAFVVIGSPRVQDRQANSTHLHLLPIWRESGGERIPPRAPYTCGSSIARALISRSQALTSKPRTNAILV